MKICFRCGTERSDQELNIEGSIHHKTPIHCLDQKTCRRIARKTKKMKEFEVTWTEKVTNHCFVIIKAKNAEEALEKFENGEFDEYDRDEASNKFENDVVVKESK